MNTGRLPVDLTDTQIEEFGRELDAIRHEVLDSRGERDRRYILKVIRTQRGLALAGRVLIFLSVLLVPEWGHPLASSPSFWSVITLGTLCLGLAKIVENMGMGPRVPLGSVAREGECGGQDVACKRNPRNGGQLIDVVVRCETREGGEARARGALARRAGAGCRLTSNR